MPRAVWNGQVIAESPTIIRFGGYDYFPQESVRWDFVHDSPRQSLSLNGRACHYVLEVDGSSNPDAAWYYPRPTPFARKIKNHVAFGNGVTVVGRAED
jgi:uncharacterized protein (DUF427 family)